MEIALEQNSDTELKFNPHILHNSMLLGIPFSYETFLQNNNVNLNWCYSMVFLLSNALIFVLINQILESIKGIIFYVFQVSHVY